MKVTEIFEARRNPHLNPKSDFVAEFYYLYHKYRDDLYLSFTYLNKLGINPQSKFNTPLGVYAYPAHYVQKILEDRYFNVKSLPYAGNRPYVQFLQARGKELDFDHYTYNDLDKDLQSLFKYVYNIRMSHEQFEEISTLKQVKEVAKHQFDGISPAIMLWTIAFSYANFRYLGDLREIVSDIESILGYTDDGANQVKRSFENKKMTIVWANILYRIMGYDYVSDSGYGIIHPSEPTQAVFLSTQSYKHVGTYHLGKEGADKTSEKYELIKPIDIKPYIERIKQEFPDVNENTKLEVTISNTHSFVKDGMTIGQVFKSIIRGGYDEPLERSYLNGSLMVIQYTLLAMEFFERDYFKNGDIYQKYNVPKREILTEYTHSTKTIIENKFVDNKGEIDDEKVASLKNDERLFRDYVHGIFARDYNIKEWQ